MAHLWMRENSGDWAAMQLTGEAFWLTGDSAKPVRQASDELCDSAQLLRRKSADGEKWFVLTPWQSHPWRINGVSIQTGLRLLRDRDELRADNRARLFFSTESLAVVESFPGRDHAIYCPRCKQEINVGDPAVRCPNCDAWHHQTEDFPCWTYAEKCSMCDQATGLDAGYRWTPECL